MNIKQTLLTATAVAALLPAAFSIQAANDNATFQVRAQVQAVCLIDSAADLDFGLIAAGADVSTSGDIVWRCTNGTAGTLSLDGGTTSADITARNMSGLVATTNLNYQLFTDAAFTQVFGDGTNGNTSGAPGLGMTNVITTTVHGQILDASIAAADPDLYSDTVTVTLTF